MNGQKFGSEIGFIARNDLAQLAQHELRMHKQKYESFRN